MRLDICLLPGDGIGPEVVAEGRKALGSVANLFGHVLVFNQALIGGIAIDQTGSPLPDETLAVCRASDAVLLGAVGGPRWSDPRASVRPEQGLLKLRQELGVFANLRPVRVSAALSASGPVGRVLPAEGLSAGRSGTSVPAAVGWGGSPLRSEVIAGVDLLIVRELTGGLYFGRPQGREDTSGGRSAVDTLRYSEGEIERLMRCAFELARGRRKKVTSVDKANVLATSRLWREVTHEVARDYPDVLCEDVLVDACAMYLLQRPADFDVIATENMFGDILSDEASMLSGSLGMLPSASLGSGKPGVYEPAHGSAPDIAGKGIANPLAAILSAAMLLRYSLSLSKEASALEGAVEQVLSAGFRTRDLAAPGQPSVGTGQMGDLVVQALEEGWKADAK